jgi:hypothetical protein
MQMHETVFQTQDFNICNDSHMSTGSVETSVITNTVIWQPNTC